MIWIENAHYIDEFRVFVKFNDGKEATIDLKNYIESKPKGTIFEVGTIAALVAFSRHKADATILEVGLGGRLDATNVVPR